VPPAGGQSAEERVARRCLIEMEGLWIEGGGKGCGLLLDSRVVDVPMVYNLASAMPSSLTLLFFKSLKKSVVLLGQRENISPRHPIRALDTLVCAVFGLQALQNIEPRQRPTGLLDQPAIAQSA
jgi:hypothetical protein